MSWFFHKVYWSVAKENTSRQRLLGGMALLGFTSLYREGLEVVLFSRVISWNSVVNRSSMGCYLATSRALRGSVERAGFMVIVANACDWATAGKATSKYTTAWQDTDIIHPT
jgi:hypothetical protein